MARIVKTAKTIRKYWKTSIFCTCAFTYGVKYARDRQKEELIRRAFCEEAKKYGNANLKPDEKPRRIMVFLNPATQGGKGTKLFNKNAAPILYLAGMEVNVVKTEYEGQVKEFIKAMETQDADAILIAGGDGTLLEGVTGYMRKEDKKFRNIPVGVIPLGETNRFAQLLFGTDLKQVSLIAEASMAVIKGVTKDIDVIKIETTEGKATYAVSGLEAGLYRYAEQRKSKNWYFGPLKHYWTYIRASIRNDWPSTLNGKLKYVEATEENTRLVAPKKLDEPSNSKSLFSWLLSFLYNQSPKPPAASDLVMDDSSDVEQERDLSTIELTVMTSNYNTQQDNIPALDIGIGPKEPTRKEFISEGWRRVNENSGVLTIGTQTNDGLRVKSLTFQPEDETTEVQWFKIDGEMFEPMPVTISLLRNKLRMFCASPPVSVT